MSYTPTTCRCGTAWTSPRLAHCSGCHTTFASVSAFDQHQTGNDPVICHPPADRGLVAAKRASGTVYKLDGDPLPDALLDHWRAQRAAS